MVLFLQVWNDFIERSEEEQAVILRGAKCLFEELKKEDLRDGRSLLFNSLGHKIKYAYISVHPGYATDSCFKRLRTKFRDYLSHQRHLPMVYKFLINKNV